MPVLIKHHLLVVNSKKWVNTFLICERQNMTFLMPKRSCLENNSLVKAALTGARSVYSVFGPMAAAKPNSDTMSLKVLWEAPISSIPPLADMNRINMTCWGSQKNNIAKSFEQRVFAKVKVELKFKIYIFFFYQSQGWEPGRWGGWRHWWWQCPFSAPS